jgi:hypothetical protein
MTLIIKPPIAPGTIISFRIMTGETLIAKLVEHNDRALTITRPVVANPINQNGQYGIYYTPFCPTVDEDEKHVIPNTALILNPLPPREELKANYIKMTTGLDIVGG